MSENKNEKSKPIAKIIEYSISGGDGKRTRVSLEIEIIGNERDETFTSRLVENIKEWCKENSGKPAWRK
jgi:hypothetical protein